MYLNIAMVKIVEMDENATRKSQLEEDVGPVILLNKFTVQPEDVDQFLKVFADTTKMFNLGWFTLRSPHYYLDLVSLLLPA